MRKGKGRKGINLPHGHFKTLAALGNGCPMATNVVVVVVVVVVLVLLLVAIIVIRFSCP